MLTLFAALALGGDLPDAQGVRIANVGGTSAVFAGQGFLVDSDGGVYTTTVGARAAIGDLRVTAQVPFVSYRTPDGRDLGVGNVRLGASVPLPSLGDAFTHALGAVGHFSPFDATWTYVNAADEVWPGAGIDAFWEGRYALGASERPTLLMFRAAVGAHSAADYEPYRVKYVRGQGAVGVDQPIVRIGEGSMFGVVGELSVQGWDTSPIDLAALGRVELAKVVRVRAGFVLPIGTWAGLAPGNRAGAREATLLVDAMLHY